MKNTRDPSRLKKLLTSTLAKGGHQATTRVDPVHGGLYVPRRRVSRPMRTLYEQNDS